MSEYAYRLTTDEVRSIRRDFSWFNFHVQRFIQFLFGIIFLYGIVILIFKILLFPFRVLATKRGVRAFIKEIIVDAPVGASWFWWTYVTFVIGRKEKTFKLTPSQAVKLVVCDQVKEADGGRLSYCGKRMIAWRSIHKSQENLPQIFLSYSRVRTEEAEFVANIMKSRGLRVWKDDEKLIAGDSLPQEIERAILSSRTFLPLLSSEYIASKWCQKELEFACEKMPQDVLPIKITSERLFIPSFVQKSLDKAGDPLHLDLNNKDSLETLRDICDSLLYQQNQISLNQYKSTSI